MNLKNEEYGIRKMVVEKKVNKNNMNKMKSEKITGKQRV